MDTDENRCCVGVLTFELRLEHSHSLKDKRQVVKSLKDRLRSRFNVAVAEIGEQEMWQRGIVSAVTVSGDRRVAEEVLQRVEEDASGMLGPMLVRTELEWM
jgi:uncharacterized protein YlxP (DUF503 family)